MFAYLHCLYLEMCHIDAVYASWSCVSACQGARCRAVVSFEGLLVFADELGNVTFTDSDLRISIQSKAINGPPTSRMNPLPRAGGCSRPPLDEDAG